MSQTDTQKADLLKSLTDFVIVTTPGLLLYFLGWAYLSYYLFLFGIAPSELKLAAQTVFVNSYVQLYGLVERPLNLLMSSLLGFLFVLFVWSFLNWIALHTTWRPVSSLSSTWRTIYFTVIFFFVLVVFFNFVLIPVGRASARSTANERWSGLGQEITVILNPEKITVILNPENKSMNPGPSPDTDKNSISAQWIKNFTSCQNRGALVSVFSDDSTLFLLCRAQDDPHSGIVFEVTKEKGLISARSVSAGG
jgi:hypothetical protein